MASSVLRQYVFALYSENQVLTGLKYDAEAIYPNWAPDAPPQDRFIILRWGVTARGIGAANPVRLGCWVYNREPDYGPISSALKEIRRILPELPGTRMPEGESILGVDYEGDSEDLYDDGYRAYVRWTSHTITASGS